MNSITGTTQRVWTDTQSGPFVSLQGKQHKHLSAITLPSKHSATLISPLAGELILFVMRCVACWVGSRYRVRENPPAEHFEHFAQYVSLPVMQHHVVAAVKSEDFPLILFILSICTINKVVLSQRSFFKITICSHWSKVFWYRSNSGKYLL